MNARVTVVGGGLAGCEAAWQLARAGIAVDLYEMRPLCGTAAHVTSDLGELVCSNSFRNATLETAVGLLKEEMRVLGSLVIRAADAHQVPAGACLAVDRVGFAAAMTRAVEGEPLIRIVREEMTAIPEGPTILATGPLAGDAIAAARAAQPGWAATPWAERLRLLRAAAELISERQMEYAGLMAIEVGKNRLEALGEVGPDGLREALEEIKKKKGDKGEKGGKGEKGDKGAQGGEGPKEL